MGFSPVDVDKMGLWQLNAAAAGFSEAHGSEAVDQLSDEEFRDISAMLDAT